MYAVNSAINSRRGVLDRALCLESESSSPPSTADIRAFLTGLKMRPWTEREFLCRLLKRAAAQASTTGSAVHLAESPHPK
jgi:hypothetical protein